MAYATGSFGRVFFVRWQSGPEPAAFALRIRPMEEHAYLVIEGEGAAARTHQLV